MISRVPKPVNANPLPSTAYSSNSLQPAQNSSGRPYNSIQHSTGTGPIQNSSSGPSSLHHQRPRPPHQHYQQQHQHHQHHPQQQGQQDLPDLLKRQYQQHQQLVRMAASVPRPGRHNPGQISNGPSVNDQPSHNRQHPLQSPDPQQHPPYGSRSLRSPDSRQLPPSSIRSLRSPDPSQHPPSSTRSLRSPDSRQLPPSSTRSLRSPDHSQHPPSSTSSYLRSPDSRQLRPSITRSLRSPDPSQHPPSSTRSLRSPGLNQNPKSSTSRSLAALISSLSSSIKSTTQDLVARPPTSSSPRTITSRRPTSSSKSSMSQPSLPAAPSSLASTPPSVRSMTEPYADTQSVSADPGQNSLSSLDNGMERSPLDQLPPPLLDKARETGVNTLGNLFLKKINENHFYYDYFLLLPSR